MVDDVAFDKAVAEIVVIVVEPPGVVAVVVVVAVGDEGRAVVVAAYKRTHNCSLRVLVHALFPRCLSCSDDGRKERRKI